jgi:hypothetical protein
MHAKWLLTAIAICSLPLFATPARQTPRPDDATCRQYTRPAIPNSARGTGQTVKLDDLIDHQDQYFGKVVTVEGEMHRIFTDRVFTIEDDDLIRDDDVLIISDVPRQQAVVALQNSIEPGKNVRVTGYVHKYNQQELECLYGPLQTESREGHSFTKSPVLIVQRVQAAQAAAPPPPAPEQRPEPAPQQTRQPAPEPGATQERVPAPEALPRTASDMTLMLLLGSACLLTAVAIRTLYS